LGRGRREKWSRRARSTGRFRAGGACPAATERTNRPNRSTPCGRRAPRRSVPLRSVPFSLCRQPLPFRLRERRGKGNQVERAGRSPIGVGGTRGAVGSARQHVTRPHTHDARDPRASSRPGPSLSPQSARGRGVHLSFFQFSKKKTTTTKTIDPFSTPLPHTVSTLFALIKDGINLPWSDTSHVPDRSSP